MASDELAMDRPLFARMLCVVLFIFCLIGVFLRIEGVLGRYLPDVRRSPDEKNYQRYAHRVIDEGVKGYRTGMRNFIENQKEHIEVPPSRIGYFSFIVIADYLSSNRSYRPGVCVSLLSSYLMILMIFFMGKALFGGWPATLGVAFFCVSPIDIIVSHRVWQDGYIGMLTLVISLIGYWMVKRDQGRIFLTLLYILFATLGLLSKETFWVYYLCLSMGIIVILSMDRKVGAAIRVGIAVIFSVLAAVLVNAAVCGGIDQWLLSIKYREAAHYANPWVIQNQTGGPLSILRGYSIMSPATSIGAIVGGFLCLDRFWQLIRKNEKTAWIQETNIVYTTLLVATVTIYFMALSLQGTLSNLRFLTIALPVICLLTGYASYRLYSALKTIIYTNALINILVMTILITALISDLRTYEYFSIKHHIGDLISRLFLVHGYRGMSTF